jgi:hypothetical protein
MTNKFNQDIARFNEMYRLPRPTKPTLSGFDPVLRMEQFTRIYTNELDEANDIVNKLRNSDIPMLDVMVDVADWLGDLTVYATSEALRYGILFDHGWQDTRIMSFDDFVPTTVAQTIKMAASAQRSVLLTHQHLWADAVDQKDEARQLEALKLLFAQLANHASTLAFTTFQLPISSVLDIIMESNFSKLGADGQPIYDADFKVQKGPNYWKPEPKIKQLLVSHLKLSSERLAEDRANVAKWQEEERIRLAGEVDIDPDNRDAGE